MDFVAGQSAIFLPGTVTKTSFSLLIEKSYKMVDDILTLSPLNHKQQHEEFNRNKHPPQYRREGLPDPLVDDIHLSPGSLDRIQYCCSWSFCSSFLVMYVSSASNTRQVSGRIRVKNVSAVIDMSTLCNQGCITKH